MDEIKFDKKNYRKHSDDNKRMIRKSLDECGAGRSIVIDAEGEIIAGNGVYEQAKKKGMPVRVVETDGSELVVVKRTDLATDDEKRRLLAMADNAASDNVEWDMDALTADFDGCELGEWGIDCEIEQVTKCGTGINSVDNIRKPLRPQNLFGSQPFLGIFLEFNEEKPTIGIETRIIGNTLVAIFLIFPTHPSVLPGNRQAFGFKCKFIVFHTLCRLSIEQFRSFPVQIIP